MREEILQKVREYWQASWGAGDGFIPGESRVPYAGRVFDADELVSLVDSSLDFWLTQGRYAKRFERGLASWLGVRHCLMVNSGSSANLLAFMSLTSEQLGDRRIRPGDEVITVAAGFPTTVAPLVQYGAIPVFVDVRLDTANIDAGLLEQAASPRTRAVMLAHTLGNPFDVGAIRDFCDSRGLWLVEDNCDALGSRYGGELTGTFGDIATSSFYPPHHMTMGEGGAVYTNSGELNRIAMSLRDWGRDCHCASGVDNTCGRRFDGRYGTLPRGYDHKYVYSHFGYNFKATDMQAAIGCVQLDKLPGFIAARRANWRRLRERLEPLNSLLRFIEPTPGTEPSWFGFMMLVRGSAPFTRQQIVRHLEEHGIQTRMLFAGNLTRHPCFDGMRASGDGFRISGSLENTDRIMSDAFWIGVYPGMTAEMIDYMADTILEFAQARCDAS